MSKAPIDVVDEYLVVLELLAVWLDACWELVDESCAEFNLTAFHLDVSADCGCDLSGVSRSIDSRISAAIECISKNEVCSSSAPGVSRGQNTLAVCLVR